MKNWKPLFIEQSRIPIWLSYLAPISISAITLGPLVIARDKLDERVKRHETIHYQQYLETLFVGFIVLYLFDYLVGFVRYRDGEVAYYNIRAEREAYGHDKDPEYLQNRTRYAWLFSKE
jgi:hypothetical protein